MRAMQIIDWGKPLEARDYPDPEPHGEEVLVRVEAAGVCHGSLWTIPECRQVQPGGAVPHWATHC